MPLRLHNTLTGRIEEFVPREPGRVAIYICGPTVYDSAHLGHMRAAVVFDVLRRFLEAQGYTVRHVQNITDVEDKIIARARAEGVSVEAITSRYIEEYHRAARALNILPPHIEPRATEHIPEMIEMIQGLVGRGFAYYAEGDVYFDVTKHPGYGKLSRRTLDELRAGARVEPGEFKRHPADFVLWKRAKPDEPSWDSPWGPGRPGWHIECSAMSLKYLGMGFDIHGGGDDLIFPHHENEIAQSEAYAGRTPFARYWVHNAMFQISGAKMSKSQHNYVAIADALAHYPPEVIRYLLVSVHYRKPMEYDPARFEDARRAVERIRSALVSAETVRRRGGTPAPGPAAAALAEAAGRCRAQYEAALDDDLNTSGALAAVFDLVAVLNRETDRVLKGETPAAALQPGLDEAVAALEWMLSILGLAIEADVADPEVPARVRALAAALHEEATHLFPAPPGPSFIDQVTYILEGRERARQLKDFATADRIRARLFEAGVQVEDLPTGPRWRVTRRDGAGRGGR
ncbi:MAG: cysteine--tRNA ligase [Armatimonadota bacterium]|nr:cysteine--tRNA ligase [Armatimonadota bacterium]MDR7451631.1 cysteine--tRNA ligase [Armatimonadota bacterium]MDR7467649.1 cysteine--tRNA ligase [Armatimonadota bacterium]MDR7492600.1 cysteine--tRNA ligase [Armatimonadota bacterium]MDR7499932.1 cysteine--tRNA ligase [Armatimonadota bacterium]